MENKKRPWPFGSYMGRAVVSAALAAGLVGAPSAAFAEEPARSAASQVNFANAEDVFDWAQGASSVQTLSNGSLPARFDLRAAGYVTPVKSQSPWGSCWSFGIASASEASIVSEAAKKGISLPEELKDVSERHLAWFAYTPLLENDDSGQGGEGIVSLKDGNGRLDSGGWMVYGTSLFSSGIGPYPESIVPYKNDEGLIDQEFNPETGEMFDYSYSADGTWSVDEEYRFGQMVEFEQSVQLPSPADYNAEGDYEGAARVNEAIKQQLYEGRGVSIAFFADQSQPGQITELGYMNPGNNDTETWAHYTYDAVNVNHAVTIVGWDDTYSKENFGNPDPVTGEVDPDKQPPADGAWIVKNSWGSDDAFPNGNPRGWGTDEDGDGGGDGYFYLSYWDKTITKPESFEFAVESTQSEDEYYFVHQYDYMPSVNVDSRSSASPMKMANVFAAGEAETVRKLTCETTRPNTQVTFDVYLLDENATLPTDGVKLATVKETFEWGGFHAVELSDEQAFTLNEGEEFSVVVTQRCLDDGQYYVSFDYGWDKDYIGTLYDQYHEEYYDMYYESYSYAATESLWIQKYEALIEEGKSADEAAAAANAYVETDEAKQLARETATQAAEEEIKNMVPTYYFEGVVNEGESYLFESGDDGNAAWKDFQVTAAADEAQGYQSDNLPIKAYGYQAEEGYDQPATEQDIAQVEQRLSYAKDMLGTAVESVDGSDVPTSQYWVPGDVRDQMIAAIAEGGDLMVSDNPTQGDAQRVSLALALAAQEFDEAKQPGTLADGHATAEAIKQLEDLIKDARNDLDQTVVSADGKDVAKDAQWVTQAAHDAFAAAIASAETALKEERPLASDIERAVAGLAAARETFDAAKADGLKEAAGPGDAEGDSGTEPSAKPDSGPGAKGDGALAQTGDGATLGIVAACVGGLSALAAGAAALRRRSGRG